MENQINSLEEFMNQAVTFNYSSEHFPAQIPFIIFNENDSNVWESFFRLHDGYNQANELYREFQRRYSSQEGPIEHQECIELARLISQIDFEDIEGLFTDLDREGNNGYTPYYIVESRQCSRDVANDYEQRLLSILQNIDNHNNMGAVREHGIIFRESGSVHHLPTDLWQFHHEPRRYFRELREALFYESLVNFVNEDFTPYAYIYAWNFENDENMHTQVNIETFSELEDLRHRYLERFDSVSITPSLRSFRSALPEDFLQLFNFAYDLRNHSYAERLTNDIRRDRENNLDEYFREAEENRRWMPAYFEAEVDGTERWWE